MNLHFSSALRIFPPRSHKSQPPPPPPLNFDRNLSPIVPIITISVNHQSSRSSQASINWWSLYGKWSNAQRCLFPDHLLRPPPSVPDEFTCPDDLAQILEFENLNFFSPKHFSQKSRCNIKIPFNAVHLFKLNIPWSPLSSASHQVRLSRFSSQKINKLIWFTQLQHSLITYLVAPHQVCRMDSLVAAQPRDWDSQLGTLSEILESFLSNTFLVHALCWIPVTSLTCFYSGILPCVFIVLRGRTRQFLYQLESVTKLERIV